MNELCRSCRALNLNYCRARQDAVQVAQSIPQNIDPTDQYLYIQAALYSITKIRENARDKYCPYAEEINPSIPRT